MEDVQFDGPLAPYADGFAEELARLGFAPRPARNQVRLAADLSAWLADAGLDEPGLTDAVAAAYAAVRWAAGLRHTTLAAFRPLLEYLRRLGVSPEPVPAGPLTPAESLLEEFRAWLLGHRPRASTDQRHRGGGTDLSHAQIPTLQVQSRRRRR